MAASASREGSSRPPSSRERFCLRAIARGPLKRWTMSSMSKTATAITPRENAARFKNVSPEPTAGREGASRCWCRAAAPVRGRLRSPQHVEDRVKPALAALRPPGAERLPLRHSSSTTLSLPVLASSSRRKRGLRVSSCRWPTQRAGCPARSRRTCAPRRYARRPAPRRRPARAPTHPWEPGLPHRQARLPQPCPGRFPAAYPGFGPSFCKLNRHVVSFEIARLNAQQVRAIDSWQPSIAIRRHYEREGTEPEPINCHF